MAYNFSGTDPVLRCSIGAFNGWGMNTATSGAYLLKRSATGSWQGIHVLDQGTTTNFRYLSEFNPSDQIVADTTAVGWSSTQTFTSTTDWMIVGFTWDGTTSAGAWVWRWKIGSGAWSSETDTAAAPAGTAGSGYRHVIGNEANLGDDARFDLVCAGAIRSNLSQATFESLTMTSFTSWSSVFTGSSAWLIGCETISTLTDRTGNGGDETARSAGITLVSDPAGWSWGSATSLPPVPRRAHRGLVLR